MLILLSLLLFLGNCPKCPEGKIKVAIFEVSGAGIEKEFLTTISDLLRIDLEDCGEYIVMSKEDMMGALNGNLSVSGGTEEVSKVCEKIKVSYAVTGNIVKLGNKLIISVALIDRWDKIRIFEDRLTASNMEDLETTIKRLAEALCKQKKASENVTVDNVTEAEAKPKLRRTSFSTGGGVVGYIFPVGGSFGKEGKGYSYIYSGDSNRDEIIGGDITQMPGLGMFYIYETSYWMGEVAGTWHFKGQSYLLDIGFSGYRFTSLQDVSPFIGGGLGMALGSRITGVDSNYSYSYNYLDSTYDTTYYYYTNPESFNALLVSFGGGVEFFRTYDFHFLLNVKYNIIFAEGIPNGLSVYFGLIYKKSGESNCCGF
ncbi:MAG: hypothetical protein PHE49_04610 [bacterium]|nr:hypothetical protein [bacterium]